MPIQRRTINIGSVLGTLAPEPSETSDLPLAPRFSEGESVMKKRKKGEEGVEGVREQQALVQTEPSVTKSPPKNGKGKNSRAPQKTTSHKSKDVKGGQIADVVGRALLLPKDMRAWQWSNSMQMIENLKRDSVVAVQGIFEAGSRLIETERLLNDSLVENDRLREVKKIASARIQEAQINKLKIELAESRLTAHNAENAARAFYDQGFDEATESLRFQLRRECNIYFLKGWVAALEQAMVNDNSELYALGREYRPFNSGTPENLEEVVVEGSKDYEAVDEPMGHEAVEVSRHQEQVQTEEIQEVEKGFPDKEDNANVDG
uniref:Uncharacterized protein n=1 Tax=Fagus sylvatica TaxID=28930 RepID=A0A2N9GE39_FAGSY